MNFSRDILSVLLLSIFASSTGTDLANNSNILLILLLALSNNNSCGCNNGCNSCNSCNNCNSCNCGCNNRLF